MIFSAWLFGLFFLTVFAVYWRLRSRAGRHVFLLAASYVFYMTWNPWLVLLILGSTVLDYGVGRCLERVDSPRARKLLLVFSLVGNLGVLGFFKYADFFILSFREMVASFGITTNLTTLSIILPVGISFYTFQTMSYTIDVYRRVIPPMRSFVDFSLYVSFFPQLVAGPIVKAKDFLPQLQTIKQFDWQRIDSGIVLFMLGMTKKLLIADQLATLVDPVFADPSRYSTRDLWLAMFCCNAQVFCDFSGYTDMAIAVSRMLGFELRPNFANPYLAVNLGDFWRRWHISLSTWLRDYLYFPLGGSRCGKWKTYRNLMITMILGGLWHGASWTFAIWGAIHGAALVVGKAVGWVKPETDEDAVRQSTINRYAGIASGWLMTLLIVHIARVFFRCQPVILPGHAEPEPTINALNRAVWYVYHLFIPAEPIDALWLPNKSAMVALLVVMFALQVYDEWVKRGRPGIRLPAPVAGMAYGLWIFAIVLLSPANTNPFVYFQF